MDGCGDWLIEGEVIVDGEWISEAIEINHDEYVTLCNLTNNGLSVIATRAILEGEIG
jgi:hypothetical protein